MGRTVPNLYLLCLPDTSTGTASKLDGVEPFVF